MDDGPAHRGARLRIAKTSLEWRVKSVHPPEFDQDLIDRSDAIPQIVSASSPR
jgi:hypothetical protein